MKTKNLLLLFFILSIILIILSLTYSDRYNKDKKEWVKKNITVSFSGKIINKKEVEKLGRSLYIICVEIEQSSHQYFFTNNKKYYTFLKIEKEKALLFMWRDIQTDSIAINMNNNGLNQYYNKGVLVGQSSFEFIGGNADANDLSFCCK